MLLLSWKVLESCCTRSPVRASSITTASLSKQRFGFVDCSCARTSIRRWRFSGLLVRWSDAGPLQLTCHFLLQVRHVNQLEKNNVALPEYFHSIQWRSQPRNLGGAKMFDFRRITLFCLEKRFSKNKMTIFSKNLGGHGPIDPPCLRLWFHPTRGKDPLQRLIYGGQVLLFWLCCYQYEFFWRGDLCPDGESCNSFRSIAFTSVEQSLSLTWTENLSLRVLCSQQWHNLRFE